MVWAVRLIGLGLLSFIEQEKEGGWMFRSSETGYAAVPHSATPSASARGAAERPRSWLNHHAIRMVSTVHAVFHRALFTRKRPSTMITVMD